MVVGHSIQAGSCPQTTRHQVMASRSERLPRDPVHQYRLAILDAASSVDNSPVLALSAATIELPPSSTPATLQASELLRAVPTCQARER